MENSISITDLPPHLIEKILSYCYRERNGLKSVCKGFYEAFWKIHEDKILLKIDLNDENKFGVSNCRPIRFSSVRSKAPNDSALNFFEERGEFVRNLEVADFTKENPVQNIFSHAENLTKVVLNVGAGDIGSLDLSKLKSLSEINIKCDKYEPESEEVVNFSTKLTNIKLANGSVETVKLRANLLNIKKLGQFLAPIQNSIKNLTISISNCESTDESFDENLKLESFSLFMLPQTAPEILVGLFTRQVNLKVLELGVEIDDQIFNLITSNLPKLQDLSLWLGGTSGIRPEQFDNLARLERLKNLKISVASLDHLIMNNSAIPVESLHLMYCVMKSSKAVKRFSKKFSKLKVLTVEGDSKVKCLQRVIPGLQELKILRGKPKVPLNLRPLNSPRENLKVLTIRHLILMDLNFLRCFPNLEEVFLIIDNREDGSFKTEVEAIFREFPKLKKVFLSFFKAYTLDFDILALVHENSNLELIHLFNVMFESKEAIEENKPEKFEIMQIERACEYDRKAEIYSLLFVTDAEVLVKSKEEFMHEQLITMELPNGLFAFTLNFKYVYRKALKYANALELD